MSYETATGYEQDGLLQPDYAFQEEGFVQTDKNGGWWVIFLLGSTLFGPLIVVSRALPPFRFADVAILLMLFTRVFKSYQLHGGFMFSYRVRLFSGFMFAMAMVLYFSMMVNLAIGRFDFFYKDLWIPLTFIRMALIAAIAASFVLEQRQINQILKGTIILSLLSILLAFGQRSGPLTSSALMNKLYTLEGEQLLTQQSSYIERVRVMGTFGNANVFGGSLVMLSAMLISFAISSKGLKRYLSTATFLALAVTVLITTGSRTSLIGLTVVSSLSFILSLRKGTRIKAFIFLILFLTIVIFIRTNAENLPINPRLKDLLLGGNNITKGESFLARLGMWTDSLAKAKDSILVGVGASKTVTQLTDNGYIYTLLRVGIIGLTLYVSMIVSLFILGIKSFALTSSPLKRAALLAFTMVVVNSAIFELSGEFFWNIRYGEVFATFMGLLCGLSNQTRYEYKYGLYNDNDNYYPIDEYESC
ncbi:MAG: O-antigen ligase family protein [Phycisphaerae bacterium]|nr:O-antigen ligase family protein [Phycisphaerae bacterium]